MGIHRCHGALALTASVLLCAACGDDDPGEVDATLDGAAEAGPTDATQDTGLSDADAASPDSATDGSTPSAYGFALRAPAERLVPCAAGCDTMPAADMDYICTLVFGDFDHYVYVQSHPVQYLDFAGFDYETDGAFISDGETATPISGSYDWGGNHHNDSITVDVGDQTVIFDHSSFGFGFRQCQPMDCIRVYAEAGGALIEDGCTADRTLPVVCVLVAPDATVPALVDNFARCPGDSG